VNFNSILIGSEDPARMTTYYTKLFGAPGFDQGGYTGWQIGNGFITVGPHSEVHGNNAQPGRLIWNIEDADVQGAFARLEAAGAIVVTAPYQFDMGPDAPEGVQGAWIATLADPDGNYFQLTSPMEM
jgi:predicted enzyme related to lactoylglutathione lyase